MTWTVLVIVGARPNLVKTAPVVAALRARPTFRAVVVHTGQHYDPRMSDVFFDDLGMRPPDHHLGVGSGTHAEQTARILEALEPVLMAEKPDLVLVPGDVNSTLAGALVAAKLNIPVAHLEAGLRSFDRSMPEEINRVVTDSVSSLHLIHSPEARTNLLHEGIDDSSIRAVGNTMIDPLFALRDRPEVTSAPPRFDLAPGSYLLVTLHRPALVDGPLLTDVLARLDELARELPVVFPVHPRTRDRIDGQVGGAPVHVRLLPPLPYLDFVGLTIGARAVLTDSGGIQEETTALGVPCFTLRATTERPLTTSEGTNVLLGLDPSRILEIPRLLDAVRPPSGPIPGWDGHAGVRAADAIERYLSRDGGDG
jgi:UDP-N-acetylglucosamine 2-epimerase (non-hydrolysing)